MRYADIEAIRKVVEEVVEQKIQPVKELLRASRLSGPSPTEIIGGIGYIVGIAGIIMYFRGRSRKEQGPG